MVSATASQSLHDCLHATHTSDSASVILGYIQDLPGRKEYDDMLQQSRVSQASQVCEICGLGSHCRNRLVLGTLPGNVSLAVTAALMAEYNAGM